MPSKPVFDVARIRAAAQARADETSIRSTADEIGMSFTGFRAFLVGGNPHPRTGKKLVDWYAEHSRRREGSGISRRDVDLAIRLLVRYANEDGRVEVRTRRAREILQQVETAIRGEDL